jgi:hypothetical protein
LAQCFEQKNPFFFKKILNKEKDLQLKAKGPVIIDSPGGYLKTCFYGIR